MVSIANRNYHIVSTEAELLTLRVTLLAAQNLAIDTETTSLEMFSEDFKLVGLVIVPTGNDGYYLPINHTLPEEMASSPVPNLDPETVARWLHELLRERKQLDQAPPVFHNASFDQLVLAQTLGTPFELSYGFDTMIASWMVDENMSHSLKELARTYLGKQPEVARFLSVAGGFEQVVEKYTEHYTLKSGAPRARIKHRLRPDWQERLLECFLKQGHDGAVSFKYMTDFTQAFMTYLRDHKIVAYKGRYPASFDHVPLSIAAVYAIDDGFNTLELWEFFDDTFFALHPDLHALYLNIQLPVDLLMTMATARGIQIDRKQLLNTRNTLELRIDELRKETIAAATDLIPAGETSITAEEVLTSHDQLRYLLFELIGYRPLGKTPKGKPSTAQDLLVKMLGQTPKRRGMKAKAEKFLRLKMQLGALQKLQSTYTDSILDKLDTLGRLHAFFNVIGAVSGRLSSSSPNVQNIPRLTAAEVKTKPHLAGVDIRSAFVADPGYVFVVADYDGMEMVATAGLSGDANLKKLLNDKRDVHSFTARFVHHVGENLNDKEFKDTYSELRQKAKEVNFLMAYGGNAFTIMNRLGVDNDEAQKLFDGYFKAFPGVETWIQEVYQELETTGQVTYPEFGFVKHFDAPDKELQLRDGRAYERQYKAALRTSQNALVQGWCAFVVKKAIVDMSADFHNAGLDTSDAQVVLQVHDEVITLVRREHALTVAGIMSKHMNREFRGVQLTATPEFKLTLSKQDPGISRDVLESEA